MKSIVISLLNTLLAEAAARIEAFSQALMERYEIDVKQTISF